MAERVWISRSEEATEQLGAAIGRAAFPGLVVVLDGELGTGKTALVRGLARGLGVQDEVSSPTYALMQTHAGRLPLHHFDAWMEGRERAFLADGGAEILDGTGVAVIEWGSRVASVLPAERLEILLGHVLDPWGATARRITAAARGTGERAGRIARILRELPAIEGLGAQP